MSIQTIAPAISNSQIFDNTLTTTNTVLVGNGTNTTSIVDGSAAITWENPVNLQSIHEKYFELMGKVKQNSKVFVDAISKLEGVDDNFKVIKLYQLLRDKKHKAFKEKAKEYRDVGSTNYSLSLDPHTDTGFYTTDSDTFTLTTSTAPVIGTGSIAINVIGSAV